MEWAVPLWHGEGAGEGDSGAGKDLVSKGSTSSCWQDVPGWAGILTAETMGEQLSRWSNLDTLLLSEGKEKKI